MGEDKGIAIIGMAGRFPGARDTTELWNNLCGGIESITRFSVDELEVENARALAAADNYVMARAIIADIDKFDAAFFGIRPTEAELIDPQQRVFLECCWHAFEDAGYNPLTYPGAAGVWAGCSPNTYFLENVCADRRFIHQYTSGYQVSNLYTMLGSNFEFLPTRVAYKLNLRGPAFSLNCGCSTSLVAVCQACLSLRNNVCDMALAGGVSITLPQKRGYFHEPGGMVSSDGHCRTFDIQAQGTVFGDGAGVVLLKRTEDALADGDRIYCIIKGFGLNNDGSARVGFTAPGVEGQARAIAMAHTAAGIQPSSISYIEAHGTATPLGDPIEVAALTQAFRRQTKAKQFCAIGTAKPNVGHLDVAAGVTGLIKTALSLRHKTLPPLLHFTRPNPKLKLEDSPFYVNRELAPWQHNGNLLRAGVSAFGIGGTNAHVVLEEAPSTASTISSRHVHVILLSAKTERALDIAQSNLADKLIANRDIDIADVSRTLMIGRAPFDVRCVAVASDTAEASDILTKKDPKRVLHRSRRPRRFAVAFMFPGQGAQYLGMGRQLYSVDSTFREHFDNCVEVLRKLSSLDLKTILWKNGSERDVASSRINSTLVAQPALFIIEYALARMWMRLGITPTAMVGHSIGEFVAACLAEVFSLEDALRLVVARGEMMQSLPGGTMVSVRMPEERIADLLSDRLSLAAVNGPSLAVIAGPFNEIAALEHRLETDGIAHQRLLTSHAFHSGLMDPVVGPFTELVQEVRLSPPRIPFLSSVTGEWIGEREALDPEYWGRHLRTTVRFSQAAGKLRAADYSLLEVGPGGALSTLVRQHPPKNPDQLVVSTMPARPGEESEEHSVQETLGRLWLEGADPDWSVLYSGEKRIRASLPLYSFERKRFWIEAHLARPDMQAANTVEIDKAGWALQNGASDHGPTTSEAEQTLSDQKHMQAHEKISESNAENGSNSMNAIATSSRKDQIRSSLVAIFGDLSGVDMSAAEDSSFLELGFDSLFLTQVSQGLQAKFGLKITFRQLLDQFSNLDALVAHIDQELPAEAQQSSPVKAAIGPPSAPQVPGPAQPAASAPAAELGTISPGGPGGAPESNLEALLKSQLQTLSDLMTKQLDVLRGREIETTVRTQTSARVADAAIQPVQAGAVAVTAQNGAKPRKFIPFRPAEVRQSGDMSPDQKRHLRSLVERYTTKTAGSKQFAQANRKHLADPRAAAGFRSEWKELVYPIVTVRSKGSKLWDVDGNEYVDVVNGYGPILFGHAPDFVTKAVEDQLKLGYELGPQAPLAGKVAEAVCAMTETDRLTFCNTGSEAVTAALRVARTVTGRNKVVLFTGAYHGNFDEVVVRGVPGPEGPRSLPVAPGIPREKVQNVVVLDYGSSEALDYISTHASELAAVLVEPVQSRNPGLQPADFLKEVRRITEKSRTALIFDEVVTGFRVDLGGCQALFGIRADLVTYGKVLGGGLPIGILAGKAAFMDALDGGMWTYGDDSYPEAGVTFYAGTFVRHPLALAAAWAVVDHLKTAGSDLQNRLATKTNRMAAELNAFLEQRKVPAHVDSFRSIAYFSFPPEIKFASLFYYYLRARGVHIQEGFPIFLTTAHSDEDVSYVVRMFQEAVVEMQDAGFLPAAPSLDAGKETSAQPQMYTNGSGSAVSDGTGLRMFASNGNGKQEHALDRVPLTESQMEVWLSASMSAEANCAYNESFTLKMRGTLDDDALRRAFNNLLGRHEALRSTFSPEGDFQQFKPDFMIEIPLKDLSGLVPAQQQTQRAAILESDAKLPFDLVRGPLVRVQLIRLSPLEHHLIFTSHHIVCDGWSTNVILDELSRCYSAFREDKVCDLPPAMLFGNYVRSQHEHFDSIEGGANENYWMEQFKRPAPFLHLPTDRPRPSVKSYDGATQRRRIPAAMYQGIKRAGAQRKCTLFVTLLAAYEALLSRLSGQDDIVVGIPTAGQSLLEDRTLVGHCVNFLPIRGNLADDPKAGDFLEQVRRTVLDGYDHQNYTYGRLIRKLSLPREPSRLPLVEVQFNLERIGADMKFADLDVEVDPNAKAFVNHDLFLNVMESDDGLILDCDYNSRLFDPTTIDRWLSHYQNLLEGLIADSNRRVSRQPLLSNDERRRIVEEWNDTEAIYPQDKLVHHLFEEQAGRTPDAIAVAYQNRQLTYAELNRKANQLAAHLGRLGVRPGVVVGIFVGRSLEMLIALLGVLKAGGAYVPMDPSYPAERISFVLEDAKVPILLTQGELAQNLPVAGVRLCRLDTDWNEIARAADAPPTNSGASSEDLAYVIYTSGSTGKPKGVAISHRAVVNLLCSVSKKPGLDGRDTLLAVTTLSFDIAALELFLPLCVGAKLVIASREAAADGNQLLALLTSSGATVMQATPVTFRLLLEAGWAGQPRLKVLCGGETLPRELANQLAERASSLWNMYGPTETTIWSSTAEVIGADGPVPVGPPIANTRFHVLDRAGELVPIGVPGELCIAGDGLARGYFERPELTAEKFIRDPFSDDSDARIYRTGDLVRRLTDGFFEFLSRIDNQVKLRGYRIELGEIETVLNRYPGVREVVVALREDNANDQRLVAYVVTDHQALSLTAVREFLTGKLPNYMLPSAVVRMSAIPLTPNGKVDRRALPPPDSSAASQSREFLAPRTAEEKTLADIWTEVLRVEQVGLRDDLFELGADSLHIFQIAARANNAGIKVAPAQFLKYRTIADLLAHLATETPGSAAAAMPAIVRVSREKYRVSRSAETTGHEG